MRCSTVPKPLGIFEKSFLPSSFCSFMQNGQWSVDTIWSSSMRRDFQRNSWWPSCLDRSGGEATHFAPSNSPHSSLCAASWSSRLK